jgi:hypothetical protein
VGVAGPIDRCESVAYNRTMEIVVACGCGLDPASHTMLAQVGLAAALATPFWFREQLTRALRRSRGVRKAKPCAGPPSDDD